MFIPLVRPRVSPTAIGRTLATDSKMHELPGVAGVKLPSRKLYEDKCRKLCSGALKKFVDDKANFGNHWRQSFTSIYFPQWLPGITSGAFLPLKRLVFHQMRNKD